MKVIIVVLAVISLMVSAGEFCGGNCPSGMCNDCYCGATQQLVDPVEWCDKYRGWSQAACLCIVSKSSRGNANAIDTMGIQHKAGLMRIPDAAWDTCNSGEAPCAPEDNLGCAEMIFEQDSSFVAFDNCEECGVCSSQMNTYLMGQEQLLRDWGFNLDRTLLSLLLTFVKAFEE